MRQRELCELNSDLSRSIDQRRKARGENATDRLAGDLANYECFALSFSLTLLLSLWRECRKKAIKPTIKGLLTGTSHPASQPIGSEQCTSASTSIPSAKQQTTARQKRKMRPWQRERKSAVHFYCSASTVPSTNGPSPCAFLSAALSLLSISHHNRAIINNDSPPS